MLRQSERPRQSQEPLAAVGGKAEPLLPPNAQRDAAERLLPKWEPGVTVQVREVSSAPRPTVISRLPPPPAPRFGTTDLFNLPFEVLGRYTYASPDGESEAEIGRGGIGRVLLALDQHLGREVAIKELLPEPATSLVAGTVLARFLSEARITGQLEHPHIVPVYELGRRSDGRLYYSMRVVRGETMGDVLHRTTNLDERLALLPHLGRVCNAIAYAHSRGVIHRDLKPDNIMIGEFGETVVLDWGIAKVKGDASQGGAQVPRGVTALGTTSEGTIVGTPLFMSPEQLSGSSEVDETSDVWALGVVLYIILCGRPPFQADSLRDLKRQVFEERLAPPRRVSNRAPRELAAITRRALRREKAERYPTAKELAWDLDAYMSGAKVSAYTYSPFDLLRRFAKRHRGASWVALVALIALMALGAVLQSRILRARDRAVIAERVALEQAQAARQSLADVFSERATSAWKSGDLAGAEMFAAWSLLQREGASARGVVIAAANDVSWQPVHPIPYDAWQAPKRQRWLVLDDQGEVRVQGKLSEDGASYRPNERPTALAWSDQANVAALGGRVGELTLWWPDNGRNLKLEGHRGTVLALAFSPDGRFLASAGAEQALVVWSVKSGRRSFRPLADFGQVTALSFSPDGRRIAAARPQQVVTLNARTGEEVTWVRTGLSDIAELTFVSEGTLLARSREGATQVWKTPSSNEKTGVLPHLLPHRANVLAQAYLDEQTLATAGLAADGVCLWDLTTAECATRLPVSNGHVRALAFAASSQTLAVGVSNGQTYLWDTNTALPVRVLTLGTSAIRGLAFDSSGTKLFAAGADGEVALWDLTDGSRTWAARASDGVFDAGFDGRNRAFLVGTKAGGVDAWHVNGKAWELHRSHGDWTMGLDLHAASGRMATIAADVTLAFGPTHSPRADVVATGHIGRGLSVDISNDGRWLATGAEDGTVLLWSAQSLQVLAQLHHHRGAVRSVRFSPQGKWLTSAGDDGTVRVWDLAPVETPAPVLLNEAQGRHRARIAGTQLVLTP